MTDKIETAIDEMLLAAIVSGEEVAAIALFGEFRAAGLDPVRSAQKVLMELDLFEQRLREARIALAQQAPTPAVLPEPIPLCMCKDRLLVDCSGEWGPGCDLGNNEKHVRVSDVSGCLACVTCGAPAAISEPAASEEWINDKPDAADYVNDRSEPAVPVNAELWALIEAYAACLVDCALNASHESARQYLKLAKSNLRDALTRQAAAPAKGEL